MCRNHVVKVLYGIFYRRLSPETQRGVCEGGGVGVAALSLHRAAAEADLDQSHPPREAPESDRGRVLFGAQADGPVGSWKEPLGPQSFCQPPGELFLLSGVKCKRSQTAILKRYVRLGCKCVVTTTLIGTGAGRSGSGWPCYQRRAQRWIWRWRTLRRASLRGPARWGVLPWTHRLQMCQMWPERALCGTRCWITQACTSAHFYSCLFFIWSSGINPARLAGGWIVNATLHLQREGERRGRLHLYQILPLPWWNV